MAAVVSSAYIEVGFISAVENKVMRRREWGMFALTPYLEQSKACRRYILIK